MLGFRVAILATVLAQYPDTCVHAGRRASKLVSLVASCFTGSYVRFWANFLPDTELQRTPIFDGRAICYPTDTILRDYLAWRQADTHINNQVGLLASIIVLSSTRTICESPIQRLQDSNIAYWQLCMVHSIWDTYACKSTALIQSVSLSDGRLSCFRLLHSTPKLSCRNLGAM